jgi:hypothetical protein
MSFHLGGLEIDELTEGLKERVTTEEDPRESPHEPLRAPVVGVEEERQRTAACRLCERGRLWRGRQRFRSLNTPGPAP